MGSATTGYPFGIIAHSHGKFGVSPQKMEFSGSNFPLHVEFSRINLYPSSASIATSKGLVSRICCLPNIGNDDFSEKPPTPILDLVENPVNLKNLSIEDLNQLAAEIRAELVYVMSKLQIYFKASLAVVELTVAMHHVFNAPVDKILWEVGQQTYAHKILTGRRSLLHTIQQMNGLSGFTSRAESEYDPFGSGHGCNSISAGLGMAIARDIKGKRERIVTVISNGTTMAGQIYEAMKNAGHLDSNLIVILNDSRHTLHPRSDEGPKTSVNALSGTLTRIQSNKSFRKLREVAKGVTKRIGMGMHEWAAKVDEYARGMIGPLGSTLFEELGLYYIGPVDGNNIEDLVSVLREVASLDTMGPVLVHVITEENYGPETKTKTNQKNEIVNKQYEVSSTSNGFPSETNQKNEIAIEQYEGSSTSNGFSSDLRYRTFTDCFVEALVMEANKDRDIVIVHAGMHMEKSLQLLHERFPTKFFDVGMAEQHAVTFSAGLSCGGLKPFCIIPSAFLQRAYDQVVHDVDQQKIPVRFVIPSAGLVGSDGPTECGAFDITFMSCLPNMIVMAPSDDVELVNMVATAACVEDRPICFRYPRGVVVGIDRKISSGIPIEIGKGKVIVEGDDVALLGYGAMVQNCLKAHSLLANLGINVTVADARFCKPLDIKLLRELCENHSFLITVEEGSLGGFGSHVAQFIALDGRLDGRVQWRPIVLPDHYIKHATPDEQLALAGLSGHHIAATALSLLGRPREALLLMR